MLRAARLTRDSGGRDVYVVDATLLMLLLCRGAARYASAICALRQQRALRDRYYGIARIKRRGVMRL